MRDPILWSIIVATLLLLIASEFTSHVRLRKIEKRDQLLVIFLRKVIQKEVTIQLNESVVSEALKTLEGSSKLSDFLAPDEIARLYEVVGKDQP